MHSFVVFFFQVFIFLNINFGCVGLGGSHDVIHMSRGDKQVYNLVIKKVRIRFFSLSSQSVRWFSTYFIFIFHFVNSSSIFMYNSLCVYTYGITYVLKFECIYVSLALA